MDSVKNSRNLVFVCWKIYPLIVIHISAECHVYTFLNINLTTRKMQILYFENSIFWPHREFIGSDGDHGVGSVFCL